MSPGIEDRLPSLHVDAGRIATVRFNDPATLNGFSPAVFARLREILAELSRMAIADQVRAVVLTGSGRAFSAGAELASVFRAVPEGASVGRHIARFAREEGTPVIVAFSRLPVPLVVAVNGVAAGIGFSLALMGDVVLAGRSASFVVPFMTRLGIVPDGGLSWHLPRLIGHARASALSLLGDRLSAEKAADWGLIWACVDDADLLTAAHEIAVRLAGLPSYAAPEMRGLLAASAANDFSTQYGFELERNEELLDGPAFREGLNAFVDKREPRYRP